MNSLKLLFSTPTQQMRFASRNFHQRLLFNFSSQTSLPAQLNLSTISNIVSLDECESVQNLESRVGDLKFFNYFKDSRFGKPIIERIADPVFYDFTGTRIYSSETTLDQIISQNFFVLSKEDSKLIAVLQNTPFDRSSAQSPSRHAIDNLCKSYNLNKQDSGILSDYVSRFSSQLLNSSYSQVDQQYIQMVNRKVLTEISLASKSRIKVYDALLSVLQKKLDQLTEIQKEQEKKIDTRSLKYMKRIFALALTKVFALQYCTYVLLSWDIMEPITCLFGIFDISLAYFFWLLSHSEFDYSNLKSRYLNKKRMTSEYALLVDSIQRTQDLIDYINEQKHVESPDLQTLLANI